MNTKGARATTVHRLLGYQSRGALGASAAAAANGSPAAGAGDANDAAGSSLVPGVFTYREGNPLEVDAVLVRTWCTASSNTLHPVRVWTVYTLSSRSTRSISSCR